MKMVFLGLLKMIGRRVHERDDSNMEEPDAALKNGILAYLASKGIPAEEVPCTECKTPDILICRDAPDETLLEIKQKEDDKDEIAELDSDLEAGGIVSRSKSLSNWNRADTVIRDGIRQMKSIDPDKKALRVVWVHCIGHYCHVYADRLKATIYGTQKLVSENIDSLITCFYFHESTFYRRRNDLDGVVVWDENEAWLYLNDHSPRFEQMLGSRFAKIFEQGLHYPAQFAGEPHILFHDGTEPRGNDDVALAYLRKKYSLSHLQRMDLGHHSVMMRRPES